MTCYHMIDERGAQIHVCGRLGPHCAECRWVAENLCDYPVGKGKTCDRKICNQHSNEIAPDIHYCTAHFHQWQEFVKAGGVKESLKNIIPFRSKS